MHPDVLDAEVGALVEGVLGTFWPGPDHHSLDATGDRAQVLVGAIALDLLRVWGDRGDVVSPLSETLVDGVAAVGLGVPGDASDRHPPLGRELGRRFLDLLHDSSLLSGLLHPVVGGWPR